MPSYNKYASSVVVTQEYTSSRPSSSRSSAMSSPGGSRSSSSSPSMGASTAYSDKYRSPAACKTSSSLLLPLISSSVANSSAAGFYTEVKESKSRKGKDVVVINHNRPNPAKNEPTPSNYSSGRSR